MTAGSKLKKGVLRDSDVPRMLVLLVSFVVGVVIAIVLPFVLDSVGFIESLVALALPFIALGVWDSACSKQWFRTVVIVAVPLVLTYFDWSYGAFAAMLLPGSVGVSGVSDLVQRRSALAFFDSVEHGAVRPKSTAADRAVSFFFDIPSGLDARNIRMNATIRRENIPWRQFGLSMIPSLVPMTVLWMIAVCFMGPGISAWSALLPVIAVSLYILAMCQMVSVIGTMDVRILSVGREHRIFDGLIGTSLRMVAPALVGLVVVLLMESHGWGSLLVVIASALFGIVLYALSAWRYSQRGESDFVVDFHGEWSNTHPVGFYSGLDGTDSRHMMDDGVPGTPRRPADFCFQRY